MPTGRRNSWAESARRGAELAMRSWMRLSANRAAGEYDLFEAAAALPEPEWPELTFRELLRLAFRDAMVEAIDHPAVRRLRGLVMLRRAVALIVDAAEEGVRAAAARGHDLGRVAARGRADGVAPSAADTGEPAPRPERESRG